MTGFIPIPRSGDRDGASPKIDVRIAQRRAEQGLALTREVTASLQDIVCALDDIDVQRPSLLPGWTRAHVISHLARNADGLLNLLTWARTGVEHAMYASSVDRDADIEEGAQRLARVLHEDLLAAGARFDGAAGLTGTPWLAQVITGSGRPLLAYEITWLRWVEVSIHLVDLDAGVGFDGLPAAHLEPLIAVAVREYAGRTDVPPVLLRADLPDGRQRDWELAGGTAGGGRRHTVGGTAGAVLAWLTGRSAGTDLTGEAPALPSWI